MKTTRNYSNEIENFSVNSLYERTNVSIPLGETVITQSNGNEIIRIIHNAGKTFVSTRQKHVLTIQEYLYANDILLVISVMCKSYGLTSKMAAGRFFADDPFIDTGDYHIYYGTMDVLWNEGQVDESNGEHISSFRPVRKLFIGYGVFEEDYAYREIYSGEDFVGRLYSIKGENGYYNILTRNAHVIPADIVFFDTITVNGIEYDVTLNSYFATDEIPQTIVVGDTELLIVNQKYE